MRGLTCLALICITSVVGAATTHAQELSIRTLLERLLSNGYEIAYSTLLLSETIADAPVSALDGDDFSTLSTALTSHGLALRYLNGRWQIVRANGSETEALPLQSDSLLPNTVANTVLESVIVTGTRHRLATQKNGDGAHALQAEDMQMIPAIGGDALRIVARLPGMSSAGVSAKPHIRGGAKDEMLILNDGVELIEPFHLADFQSIFSAINSNTVESVDFYTGGFPARYGNRMSGVMDISTRSNIEQAETRLGASLYSSSFSTQGSDLGNNWLVSARRGNLSDVLKQVNSKLGEPKFSDAYARFSFPVNWFQHSTFSINALWSADDIRLSADERDAFSRIDNHYAWAKLETTLSDTVQGRTVLSATRVNKRKRASIAEPEVAFGNFESSQKINKWNFRTDWQWAGDSLDWEGGLTLERANSDYRSIGLIEHVAIGRLLGQGNRVDRNMNARPSGWSGGAYFSARVAISDQLDLLPGVRWDYQDYYRGEHQAHWSPRLGLRYRINPQLAMRLSAGQFYQPQAIHELQFNDGETDFQQPQRADQGIIALDWHSDRASVTGELYYKRYESLRDRYENLFNAFVLLPELEADRVLLQADKARVWGMDLSSTWRFATGWQTQLRYSYMHSRERIGQTEVKRRWQQSHTFNGLLSWSNGPWSAGLALAWHSGWQASGLQAQYPLGTVLDTDQIRNNEELRNFLSLDANISYTLQLKRSELNLFADVGNLLGRKNIAGLEFAAFEEGDVIEIERDTERLLPTVPNIGFVWTF